MALGLYSGKCEGHNTRIGCSAVAHDLTEAIGYVKTELRRQGLDNNGPVTLTRYEAPPGAVAGIYRPFRA